MLTIGIHTRVVIFEAHGGENPITRIEHGGDFKTSLRAVTVHRVIYSMNAAPRLLSDNLHRFGTQDKKSI